MNATETVAGSADDSGASGQNDLEAMLAAARPGGDAPAEASGQLKDRAQKMLSELD